MPEQIPQTASRRRQDRVFNDETCCALRRGGRDFGRLLAVVGTFLLAETAMVVLHAIPLAPLPNLALTAVVLIGGSGATVAVMKRVNLIPTRETFREMKRDLTREARAITGDPQAIESRIEETSESSARPELAYGLPPEDCVMIFVVLVSGVSAAVASSKVMVSVLLLGGSVAASGLMLANFKYVYPTNTYPPEDPPHD